MANPQHSGFTVAGWVRLDSDVPAGRGVDLIRSTGTRMVQFGSPQVPVGYALGVNPCGMVEFRLASQDKVVMDLPSGFDFSPNVLCEGGQQRIADHLGNATGFVAAISPDAMPLEQWVHVAGTYGEGQVRLYVDGT